MTRRRSRELLLMAAGCLALASCGGRTTHSGPNCGQYCQQAGQNGSVANSAPPTCGQFCQQAGGEGGPSSEGCLKANGKPFSTGTVDGCLPCPNQDCLDVLSASTRAANGVVPIVLRCRLSTPCDGALILVQPNHQVGPGGNRLPASEFVGGSDIHLPPGSTGSVKIGLTALGERLVSSAKGYLAVVSVRLHVYGSVGYPAGGGQPKVLVRPS